jgi:hypothetical protein
MAKLTRQEELKLQKEMEDKKKQMLKDKELKQKKIQTEYDSIIRVVQQSARKLKDDELEQLNEKLKTFFNKTI